MPTAEEELERVRKQYQEMIAFHEKRRQEWEEARRIMGQTIEDQTKEIDGLGRILDEVIGMAKTALWEQRLIAPTEIRSIISQV
jgi:lactate dehydrogenase-like 2-hydroxyacid dehydrogenase